MAGTLLPERFCVLFARSSHVVCHCRATPYCHAHVARPWSSLSKTWGVTSLWRYGVCLSLAKGRRAVTNPRVPPHPVPTHQEYPKRGEVHKGLSQAFKISEDGLEESWEGRGLGIHFLQPSPPFAEQKNKKTVKFHFKSPKIPFCTPPLGTH